MLQHHTVTVNSAFQKNNYTILNKPQYKPEITEEIFEFAKVISERFNTAEYCIWNTDWLNEFTQHQQVKKLIIIEIEEELIEPIYNELKDNSKFKFYLNPNENEIDFQTSEGQTPVVIKLFIPKSPILKRQIKTVNIHTPLLEKIVLDLHYYGASLGFISSKIAEKYTYNFSKVMSYTKLKLGKEEMKKFMTHISPPMKFKWTTTKEGKIYTLEIQLEKKQILGIESTGHWKSETGGYVSFKEFLNGEWHDFITTIYGDAVLEEVKNTVRYL